MLIILKLVIICLKIDSFNEKDLNRISQSKLEMISMKTINISLDQPKSIFKILYESFYLYINNFINLSKPMVFPIAAHLIGIPYIFIISFYYPTLFPLEQREDLTIFIIVSTILLTLPGFALFLKGFWAYLVAMVSLNRYAQGLVLKDSGVTVKASNQYVDGRSKSYVVLLFLLMLLWIAGIIIPGIPILLGFIIPPLLVFFLVFVLSIVSSVFILVASIYLSLSFQVFAFEDFNGVDILKRSYFLVKNNFWRTFLLTIILMVTTSMIMPVVIHTLCQLTGIVFLLSLPLKGFATEFLTVLQNSTALYPDFVVDAVNQMRPFMPDPTKMISETIVTSTIDAIVTAGLLPFGTICFSLLYFDIILKKEQTGNK